MSLLDLFFPKKCLNCGKHGRYICPECMGKVRKSYYSCPHCAKASFMPNTHLTCQTKTPFLGKISLWKYEGVVRKSILALKYKFAYSIANELADVSAAEIRSIDFSVPSAVLIPVPLHTRRENWRGFNQASVLGKAIAREIGWKFEEHLVERKTHTLPQANLSKLERMQNISGKFAVNNELVNKYRNKTIVIFDDVWTTGSTMREIATELNKAGMERIWGLTIAGAQEI